jgi:putative intracellular protease/amidase
LILVNQHIKQTNHRNRHHKSKGSRKYIHRPNLQKIDSEPGAANIKPIVEQLKTNGCVTTNKRVTSRIIMMTQRALLVLTSHTELGHTGRGTGFYYDEMAAPYWTIRDLGWQITLASVAGGPGLPDPKTVVEPDKRPPNVARFMADPAAMDQLETTLMASEVNGSDYDCVFLPGGHGAMWDFDDNTVGQIVTDAWASGAVVGAVCHGPSGLLQAKETDGSPLVQGKRVNSFTNRETEQIELMGVEPFLLETRLRELGALFECSENFTSHAVRDGRLITGQNPQSTAAVCQLLHDTLGTL